MKLHLEGMGAVGAMTALLLDLHEIPFTWHDIDAPHTAWKASTGAVYPSGSTRFGPDEECHRIWGELIASDIFRPDLVEAARWTFNHKSVIPHHGRYKATNRDANGLRMASIPSYHVNVAEMVRWARETFAVSRIEDPKGVDGVYVKTHGFTERSKSGYWGWSRRVRLDHPYEGDDRRPAFTFYVNRFTTCYAYPIPGSDLYFAGSSLYKQTKVRFKELDAQPKYEAWTQQIGQATNGAVRVASEEGELLHGWRPIPLLDDMAWITRDLFGAIQFRPMTHGGIRHFPALWAALCDTLKIRNRFPLSEVAA